MKRARAVAQPDTRVGRRLHELRKHAKLSIADLASRSGVSAGMISQIERGMTNPSIKILEKLHTALAVPLNALLEDAPQDSAADPAEMAEIVLRTDERAVRRIGTQGMTKEVLTPPGDYELEVMLIGLPPGASSEEVLIGQGEKAGLLMSGSILLTVGGRSTELSQGDSFQFSSAQAHSIRNTGAAEARILWIKHVKSEQPQL